MVFGGIFIPHIKDTKFLTIYQSICYKVFNNLRLSLSINKELQYSADSALADIYREEGLIDCLYFHLVNAKSNFLSALSRFANLFSPEQQATLIKIVKKEFPIALGGNPDRKSYRQLAGQISQIARTCPAGKKLAAEIVDAFRGKYPNRPALLEELTKVKVLDLLFSPC